MRRSLRYTCAFRFFLELLCGQLLIGRLTIQLSVLHVSLQQDKKKSSRCMARVSVLSLISR